VVDLMDALRKSVGTGEPAKPAAKGKSSTEKAAAKKKASSRG